MEDGLTPSSKLGIFVSYLNDYSILCYMLSVVSVLRGSCLLLSMVLISCSIGEREKNTDVYDGGFEDAMRMGVSGW